MEHHQHQQQQQHHHAHPNYNPLVHLTDLPNLEYEGSLYQQAQQTVDDLELSGNNNNDHAGITTLAEFADMAGSMDQRSRLTAEDRLSDGQGAGDEEEDMVADRALPSFEDGALGEIGELPERSAEDLGDHDTINEQNVGQDGTASNHPLHLSLTRMVLVPAHFPEDPYIEQFDEDQVPDYLRARAREFVFLKHTEKKNDLDRVKKEQVMDDQEELQAGPSSVPPDASDTLGSTFQTDMSSYPPYDLYSQLETIYPKETSTSASNIPNPTTANTASGLKLSHRKLGGPLQYAWISEYRCCFSGKHRERAHVSKSGRKRKRAPSTKVGCKAKFILRKVIKTGLVEATYHWTHNGHDPADSSELDRARKKKANPDLKDIVWGQPIPRSQAEIEADRTEFESRDVKRRRVVGSRVKGNKGKQVEMPVGEEARETGQSSTGAGYLADKMDGGTLNEHVDALDRALQYGRNVRFEVSQSRSSHLPPPHGQPDFHLFDQRYEGQAVEGGYSDGHKAQAGFSRTSQQTSDMRTTRTRQEMEEHAPTNQYQSHLHDLDPTLVPVDNTSLIVNELHALAALPVHEGDNPSRSTEQGPSGSSRRPEALLAEFERSYQDMGKLLVTAQRALEDVRRSGRPEEAEASSMEEIWQKYGETVAEYKRLEGDMKQGGLLPSAPDDQRIHEQS